VKKYFGFILPALIWLAFVSCAPKHPLPFASPNLPADPALVHGVLPNGFQYVLLQNHTPKDRVSIHLNVFAGSVHETDEQQGIAHFLEHMLFNGTQHFQPGELVAYFQSIGMDFGADVNASTSFFHTVYDVNLPKGDQAHLEDALLVISDYAEGALLLEDEIEKERGIILAEKQERDSVSYQTFKQSFAFELPGSILPKRFPIGIAPVIQAADRELIKNFYDSWYRPDNMVLVMVGDMDIQRAQELIQKRFASFYPRASGKSPEASDMQWTPHKGIKPFYFYEPEAAKTKVTVERITYTDVVFETPKQLKQDLVRTIADTIFQNRLSHMISQQTAAFSSASAYSGIFLHHISMAAVTADCRPENWETTLVQLEKLLRQALESGFTQKELDFAKAVFISKLEAEVKQADTRKTARLARSLLQSIQNKKMFLSPGQRKELLLPHLEKLSLDQVNQAFKDSWQADHRLVLVTGNAQIGSRPSFSSEDRIRKIFVESRREPADLFVPVVSQKFPYLPMPDTPAQITHQQKNENNLGITRIDLDNNIRLNLKQTDFQKGKFLFKAVFGRGRACQPLDMPGLAHISQQTVRLSGLGAMDLDQLKQALAGRDVDISFAVGESYFSLEGTADPEDIKLVFQLIYAHLADPGFRPEALDLAKTRYRQMYDSLKRTPDGIMRIHGNRFLAKNNPLFGMAHPDEVDRIRLKDIQSWLSPFFFENELEISIAGDFDPEAAIFHARTVMGGREPKNTGPPACSREPVAFPKGEELDLTLDTKIEKGVVRMAFLTDDFWDIQQTRQLSILSRVVSDRLRKIIREKLGEVYSAYVFNQPSMVHEGYGIMQMVVPVSRKNKELVEHTMKNIVKDIVMNGITDEEVELALHPVLSQLADLRQTNTYWLNSVMADSKNHPEKLQWAENIVAGYASINADDLDALANRYLDLDTAALIRIIPEK
jgi:zinc protease